MYLLWNGEDERGVQAWNQRPTRRLLVRVGNDEGLDDGGSSGGSESLDLKYIFKVQPAGLTNSQDAGHEEKKRVKNGFWPGLLENWSCHFIQSGKQGEQRST